MFKQIYTIDHTNASHYSDQGFWQKLKRYAKQIGEELLEKSLCLYYVAQEPDVPPHAKAIVYGSLSYLISPVDFIPDAIPIIGYSDDLAVIAFAFVQLATYITPEIKQRARTRMRTWFD